MKKLLILFLLTLAVNGYGQRNVTSVEQGKVFVSEKGTDVKLEFPPTPDQVWGKLFTDVQLNKVLGDNKAFVDAVPKFPPHVILKKYYDKQKTRDTSFHLKDFIFQNFKVPVPATVKLPGKATSLKEHLEQLWPALTRKADVIEKYSSLLPLPKAYVVPGGRFREIYYWDSYFTMQGLAVSNRYD